MSAELVDERVVEMRFDNKDFEKNVDQSIKTIDKLKKSLDFEDAGESFENISKAASKCDLKPLEDSLESVSVKFDMLELVAAGVLSNIVNKAIDAGTKLAKSLSIDQISAGWTKYQQKTESVQTIMSATGLSINEVNGYLEKLIWFADETSYSFTDMVNNIGKFTSAGVDLDIAVDSMMGISNWAAQSGAGIQQASRAMYNLSQSIGMGYVGIQDWKSIELANMATLEFKQTVIDTAVEMGVLNKAADGTVTTIKGTEVAAENMRETLKEKWFTGDVLNEALRIYNEFANAVYERQKEYEAETGVYLTVSKTINLLREEGYEMDSLGAKAFQRAQEAITFQQAMDATMDAVSSGWMRTFEIIFGNYEQSKKVWTELSNDLWDIFASGGERRNEALSEILDSNYKKMLDSMPDAEEIDQRLWDKLKDITTSNKGEEYAKDLFSRYNSLEDLLKENADSIYGTTLQKAFTQVSEDFIKEADTAKNLLTELTEGRFTLKQAAIRLAQNQYGFDEKTQKETVEALGLDYEYLTELAEAWKTGIDIDWKTEQKNLEKSLDEQIKYYKEFSIEIKKLNPLEGFFDSLTDLGGRDKLIGGFQNILKTFKNVYLTIVEIKNGISDLTGSGSFLGNLIDGFYMLTSALGYLDDQFEIVQETIYDFFHGGIQNLWDNFWNGSYYTEFEGTLEEMEVYVPGVLSKIKTAYDTYIAGLPQNIAAGVEKVRTTISNVFGALPEQFKSLKEKIFGKLESKNVITDILTGETKKVYYITGGLLNGLKDKIRNFSGGLGGKLLDGFLSALRHIADFLFGYEKDGERIKGAIEFIYDKATALWERLKDIGKVISDAFGKVDAKFGITDKIKEGLQSIYDSAPFKAIRKFFGGEETENSLIDPNKMKNSFKTGFSFSSLLPTKEKATDLITKIKDKINELVHNAGYKSVHDFFFGNKKLKIDNLPVRIINDIKNKFNELKQAHPWIQSIVDFIEKQIEKIKSLISDAGGNIAKAFDNVKKYLFGYDVKKDGLSGFIGEMEHVDGLIDKINKSIGSLTGDLFKKNAKKSLLQQITEIFTGGGRGGTSAITKAFRIIEVFLLSLSGLNVALLGLNLKGFGFEVKSPFAEMVDIIREFAISVMLIVASLAGLAFLLDHFKDTPEILRTAAVVLAVIMLALIGISKLLDNGKEQLSLKDIIMAQTTTVPALRALAMVLAEVSAIAAVFALLAKLVGIKYVMAGAGAIAIIMVALGLAIAALYLPDALAKDGKKVKSKAGDLIGITLVLIALVPFLLTLGAVIAEMFLIARIIPNDPKTLWAFGLLIAAVLGSIIGILLILKSFSGLKIPKTLVASLLFISVIIGELGIVLTSFAIITRLFGSGVLWTAFGILNLTLVVIFGFIFGLNKLTKEGIDTSVIVTLGILTVLIGVIGHVVTEIAKMANKSDDSVWEAFKAIIGSMVGAFAAIFILSRINLSAQQIQNALVMMGMIGALALEIWGLMEIAKRADITSYDALLPMLAAIGEMAVAMIVLSGAIWVLGKIGDTVLSALGPALKGILAVTVAVGAIGVAFFALSALFDWLAGLAGEDNISDSVDNVMGFLVSVMRGIGEMVGALIGGFGEGVTSTLPDIGTNIAGFAENLQPFFDAIAGLDEKHSTGIDIFTKILLSLIADTFLAGLASLIEHFTFGTNSMATNLGTFTTNLQPFLTNISALTPSHATGANYLVEILKKVYVAEFLTGIGSLMQVFTFSANSMAGNLATFTTNLQPFLTNISALKKEHVDGAARLVLILAAIYVTEVLTGIASLIDLINFNATTMATNLSTFTTNLQPFLTNISTINKEHLVGAKYLTSIVKEMVKQDMLLAFESILTWFQGKLNFNTYTTNLETIADGVVSLNTKLSGINKTDVEEDIELIKAILDFLTDDQYKEGGIAGIFDHIINGKTNFKGLFNKLNIDIADGFSTFSGKMVDINITNAKKAAEVLPVIMDMLTNKNYRTGGISGFFDDVLNGKTDYKGMFDALNTKILPGLRDFTEGINAVNEQGEKLDYSNVSQAAEAVKSIIDLMSMDTSKLINDDEKTFFGWKVGDSEATKLEQSFQVITGTVVPAIKNIQKALVDAGVESDYMQGTIGVFNELIKSLTDFSKLGLDEEQVAEIGNYIITGLVESLDAGVELVKAAATRIAEGIKQGLTLTLKIESPSKVARDIGEYFYEGLIEGIEAGDDKAYKVAQMLGMEVADGLKSSIPKKIEGPKVEYVDPFMGAASDSTEGLFNILKYGFSEESFKNGEFNISYENAVAAAEKAGDTAAVEYMKAFEGKFEGISLNRKATKGLFEQLGISNAEEFFSGSYANQIARSFISEMGDDLFGENADFIDFDMSTITDALSETGSFGQFLADAINDLSNSSKKAKETAESDTKVKVDSSQAEEAVSWLDKLSEQYKVTDTALTTQASAKLQKGEKLTEKEALALQNVWDGVMLGMYGSGEERLKKLQELGVDWYSLLGISDGKGGLDWTGHVNSALEYADTVEALGKDYKTSDLFKDIMEGKWGEGEDRVKALEKAGYDAKKVQDAFAEWYNDPSYDPGDYYGKITDEERELAEQTEKLNEVLNTTPEGAFRTVADFLEGVSKVIEDKNASEDFKKFMGSIEESWSGMKLENASEFEKIANFLLAIRTVSRESTGISEDFASFITSIQTSLDSLVGFGESGGITPVIEQINAAPDLDTAKTQPLVDFLNNLMNAADAISNSTVGDTISTLALTMIISFEGYYENFTEVGKSMVMRMIAGMISQRTAAYTTAGTIAGSILTGFKEQGVDKAGEKGKEFMEEFSKGIVDSVNSATEDDSEDGINSAIDAMNDMLSGIIPDGGALAANMIDGIVQGIIAGADKVKAVMAWLAAGAQGEFNYENEAASPSRKYIKFAGWMTEGIVIGIKDGSKNVIDAMGNVATGTVNRFSSIISSINDDVEASIDPTPVIRPVVDMSDVYDSAKNIDAALSTNKAVGISTAENLNKNAQYNPDGTPANGSYTFVQNNYSPKALSKLDIYRQTKNQFAMMKGVVNQT